MHRVPESRLISEEVSPFARIAQVERAILIEQAGRSCSPQQRRLLLLRYDREMSFADIGRQFGVSRHAVGQMHAVAMRRLRLSLARMGIESIEQI